MRRGTGKLVVVILAVAWTAGLRAAVRWHSSGAPVDDSRATTADTRELVERLPELAPPLQELGKADAVEADAKTVITLLRAGRTAELEQVLEGMQDAFEQDPSEERGVERLLDGLAFVRDREVGALDAWVERAPKSFAAYAARGAARVAEFVREDRRERYEPMNHPISFGRAVETGGHAREDLERALELRPGFAVGLTLMMKTLSREGRKPRRVLLDRSSALCPTCTGASIEYMRGLLPSGGGDLETARSFAEQAQARAEKAPRLRALLGYLDWEEAGRLELETNWQGALDACERALQRFAEPDFERRKATLLFLMGRYQDSVDALSSVLDRSPYDVEARVARARAYNRSMRYQAASDDLRLALQLDRDDKSASELYAWLVDGVDHSAQQALRRGDLPGALEAYDRALQAVPEKAEFQRARRAIAARLGVHPSERADP